jgi:hypothetical protein
MEANLARSGSYLLAGHRDLHTAARTPQEAPTRPLQARAGGALVHFHRAKVPGCPISRLRPRGRRCPRLRTLKYTFAPYPASRALTWRRSWPWAGQATTRRKEGFDLRSSRTGKRLLPPNPRRWEHERNALDIRHELALRNDEPLDPLGGV